MINRKIFVNRAPDLNTERETRGYGCWTSILSTRSTIKAVTDELVLSARHAFSSDAK